MDFKSRCEYSLIRKKLEWLFRKYDRGELSSSTAYAEAGQLLDTDALCGEAMFLRFYALRILRRPGRDSEFFAHEGRPEARLLRQVVEDCLTESAYEMDREALHYYLLDREKVLELMGREFHQYLHDFYFSWLKAEPVRQSPCPGEAGGLFRAMAGRVRVFESIYGEGKFSSLYMELVSMQDKLDKLERLFPSREEYQLFFETRCLQYLEPYLQYLVEAEGNLEEEEIRRFGVAFAKINEILAAKLRELADNREELRLIGFSVIEKELDRALKDNMLFMQLLDR